ncbi:putative non-specific serine/threonine protein kinase [Helianthus annuus]|nr:putative non-specific serine/threonine protein kinase [Helianthus annuus]
MSYLYKAVVLKEKGNLMDLVDPRLGSDFNKIEAVRMMEVAILCTNQSPALRPTMSEVVNMLEGRTILKESDVKLATSEDDFGLQAVRGKVEDMQLPQDIVIQQSSSTINDLYPNSQISTESRLLDK